MNFVFALFGILSSAILFWYVRVGFDTALSTSGGPGPLFVWIIYPVFLLGTLVSFFRTVYVLRSTGNSWKKISLGVALLVVLPYIVLWFSLFSLTQETGAKNLSWPASIGAWLSASVLHSFLYLGFIAQKHYLKILAGSLFFLFFASAYFLV